MHINLLYLPLFNFAYLFFPFLLSFPLNIFVSFIFIALFPNWHLALVLLSNLCLNQFCSSRYNFWFPLFARSIYCTLFLLDCFDFAYGCICMKVQLLSRVRLFVTPQAVAYQAPLSMGFSRQQYWSRLPFPSPICVYSII